MLLWRTKKDCFKNLNVKDSPDNKKIWKTIQPYFRNKGLNSNKMLLNEKGELISDKKQLASIMNKFFISIAKSLNSTEDQSNPPVTCEGILKNL